jgi:uncharacterized damage-inducible protein DinB
MIALLEPVLNEFREEVPTTRRVLERVPADKLAWKPHPKSMSLGQLALHVATIPTLVERIATTEEFAPPREFKFEPPKDVKQIQETFEKSVRTAEERLESMDEKTARGHWRIVAPNGKEVFAKPRIGALRTVMLNHWYHHRGQLSVYLRLLDVPLPSIYGPSADESPFS